MKVFAYCAQQFANATRRAAGVRPMTCPPVSAATFSPDWLRGFDFLYFDFHGQPGEPCWYAESQGLGGIPERTPAVTAVQLREAKLDSAVVFAATCYLADEDSPMLDALLDAGAAYVVGGDGQNWGPAGGLLYGAPLLGQWLRRLMRLGFAPMVALALAKRRVAMDAQVKRQVAAAQDTLAFRAYVRAV